MATQKVFSIDVWICATAYIRADNEREAAQIARDMHMTTLELPTGIDITTGDDDPIEISGAQLDSEALPDVSLSPAMTLYGPLSSDTGSEPGDLQTITEAMELAEEYEVEDEADAEDEAAEEADADE